MAGRDRRSEDKPDAESADEGFLSRWSRRKTEAKTAEEITAVDPQRLPDADALEGVPAARDPDEPPAFDVSTLPDIDSLGPGSDFSMFMQTGVPAELKTKALRKLWRVKPELANLDGLLDYGEDLTGSFKVVDHLKTAYEVGRGFLKDQADQAADNDEATGDDAAVADAELTETPESRAISEDEDDVDGKLESDNQVRKG